MNLLKCIYFLKIFNYKSLCTWRILHFIFYMPLALTFTKLILCLPPRSPEISVILAGEHTRPFLCRARSKLNRVWSSSDAEQMYWHPVFRRLRATEACTRIDKSSTQSFHSQLTLTQVSEFRTRRHFNWISLVNLYFCAQFNCNLSKQEKYPNLMTLCH